ncbi:MAG: hypothetical protein F4094_01950 [Synechococcus sp. SB0672_bin_6]|nr:hypothetical protein [Synechococcus sp. SB0672_bin_6]
MGEDSLEDPAVWVWVVLGKSQEFPQLDAIREHARKLIGDQIAALGEDHWVYVQFRTKAEEEGLDNEDQSDHFDGSRIRELLLNDQQEQPWKDLVANWEVEIREKPLEDPAIWVWGIPEGSQEFDQKRASISALAGASLIAWQSCQGKISRSMCDSAQRPRKQNRSNGRPWSARTMLMILRWYWRESLPGSAATGKTPSRSGSRKTQAG